MKKKVVSGLLLTLLLLGMFSVALNRAYGQPRLEWAYCGVETGDGGYALAGSILSGRLGCHDVWLIKTDVDGNLEWSGTYGGADIDDAYAVVQTGDGGYALAGETWSFGAGLADSWLVKVDAAGNMEWNKTYGGTDYDAARSVVETGDGGYALAGGTELRIVEPDQDFWLVKVDSDGNMEWNKTYGDAPESGWLIYVVLAATILIIAVVIVVYVKRKKLQLR